VACPLAQRTFIDPEDEEEAEGEEKEEDGEGSKQGAWGREPCRPCARRRDSPP